MSEVKISLIDFLDPSKPWVLGSGNKSVFDSLFDFVPNHYRYGPWHVGSTLILGALGYILVLAVAWMRMNTPMHENGWLSLYQLGTEHYQAFTNSWYITLAVFLWMSFICWNILYRSPMGKAAWITFTVWSWTTVTIRHGLVVLAPFVPATRIPAEILRFPGLLSATITTFVWNLVLFPAICFIFIKDEEQRKKFIGYFTNFRLTQLHVFNFIFAVANGVVLEPRRPLHLADFAAAVCMFTVYMFYFCVLDRLGIHIYPIFSPRTPLSIPSLLLLIAATIAGFRVWSDVLHEGTEI